MRSFRVYIQILLVVTVTMGVFFFGYFNMEPVSVTYFGWSLPNRPLFIYLLLAAVGGMVVSTIIFGLEMVRLKARARRETKLRMRLEREVDELRNRPLLETKGENDLDIEDSNENDREAV